MESREEHGVTIITFTSEDIARLAERGPMEVIPAPGEGRMVVIDRLPHQTFSYGDHGVVITQYEMHYHIEEGQPTGGSEP